MEDEERAEYRNDSVARPARRGCQYSRQSKQVFPLFRHCLLSPISLPGTASSAFLEVVPISSAACSGRLAGGLFAARISSLRFSSAFLTTLAS